MVEVFIGTLIFTLVVGFLVYITYFVGRNANIIRAESRAETEGRNAAELIRRQLTMAKNGTITIGSPNTSITWKEHTSGSTNSLSFNTGTRVLTFDNDLNAGGTTRNLGKSSDLARLTDVRFNQRNFGGLIDVTVESRGNALGGDKVIVVSQTFTIRPRN